MKKYIELCLKAILSGIFALIILSVFSLIYYNPPINIANPEEYTNFKFPSNQFWSFMTEGYGFGVTNQLGFNDTQDPIKGKKSIYVLGSSHTEALQVKSKNNFVSLLENKLHMDNINFNDYQCINLGVSGHSFGVVVSNFENFIRYFSDVDYVIIETDNVKFSDKEIKKMLNKEYHNNLGEYPFFYETIRRIPYFRLIAKQYMDIQNNRSNFNSDKKIFNYEGYDKRLEPVIKMLSDISKEHGFKIIILNHSPIKLDIDNKAYAENNKEAVNQFRDTCKEKGIYYLNTDEIFCAYGDAYAQLPYGFFNTIPGEGHLNEVGHKLIAELLYDEVFSGVEK